jgi:ribosome-binding protein aMBF1 (putative translation factor)
MSQKRTTRNAVEIIHNLHFKDAPDMMRGLEYERIKADIGQKIYDLRHEAGLTHEQLAERVGTTAKILDALEETDYKDHQLGEAILMLKRIAKTLGKRIELQAFPELF